MVDLRQQELIDWEIRNFGKQEPYRKLLGMIEELGEIAHSLLKAEQGIREGKDGKVDLEELGDGVADIFIYGSNLLSSYGINVEETLKNVIEKILSRDWIKYPKNGVSE